MPGKETVIAPNPDMIGYGFPRRDAIGEEMMLLFGVPTRPRSRMSCRQCSPMGAGGLWPIARHSEAPSAASAPWQMCRQSR